MTKEKPKEKETFFAGFERDVRVRRIHLVSVEDFRQGGMNLGAGLGKTLNISRSGVEIEMKSPLPVRTKARLSIALDGKTTVEVEAEVKRITVVNQHCVRMGMEFTNMSEATRAVLDQYIAASPKPAPPSDLRSY